MELDQKVAKLVSLACVIPKTFESSQKIDLEQAKAAEAELAAEIKAKLESKSEFTVFHAFEPNGRLTVAHASRYVAASKIVKECGGRYIVFVADVAASERHAFARKEDQINLSAEYGIATLRALGVEADFIKSSEYTLSNHELFIQMVENSIKIPVSAVKSTLPPPGKKEVVTASMMIAPCLQCSEILHLGADFVIVPAHIAPQMSLLKTFCPENTPVVIPLPSILNLKGAKAVSPKPDPKNVFFFEDQEQQIGQKANGTFCTDNIAENPVFQYISYVLIPVNGSFTFNEKQYTNNDSAFADDFAGFDKKNLKGAFAQAIDAFIAPSRGQIPEALTQGPAKMATTVQ